MQPDHIPLPDTEAEAGVIGALLSCVDALESRERFRCCNGITAAHFTDGRLAKVWMAAGNAVQRGEAIDPLTVEHETGVGMADLMRLSQPTSLNLKGNVRRLQESVTKRRLANGALGLIESCNVSDFSIEHALARVKELATIATSPGAENELLESLLSSDALPALELRPRASFLGSWFREGDLGFVFGSRGLGKTWLVHGIARAIAEGNEIGPWKASGRVKVVYVDGEMPLDAIRDRDMSLNRGSGDLSFLNHEQYFDKTGKTLNLSNPDLQQAILALVVRQGVRVLVLDNLSCLFSGVKENDADDWEKILPWLLELRRRRVSVLMVHHSGRAGIDMRGTSRREDAAFWIIRLSEPSSLRSSDGARFVTHFTKNRQGSNDETQPLEWSFESTKSGKVAITCRRVSPLDEFKQWLRDGHRTASEIADAMGTSKSHVSKLAARGMREGWLKKNGRDYELANEAL